MYSGIHNNVYAFNQEATIFIFQTILNNIDLNTHTHVYQQAPTHNTHTHNNPISHTYPRLYHTGPVTSVTVTAWPVSSITYTTYFHLLASIATPLTGHSSPPSTQALPPPPYLCPYLSLSLSPLCLTSHTHLFSIHPPLLYVILHPASLYSSSTPLTPNRPPMLNLCVYIYTHIYISILLTI